MSRPLARPKHPWMARFAKAPLAELEAVLGGYARVEPYTRLDPGTVLITLFQNLDPDDPDRILLDNTAQAFLAERRREKPTERNDYGLARYARELAELFLAARELPLAGAVKAWAVDFSALSSWLEPLRAGDAADARLAYWQMLAHHPELCGPDRGEGLRGHWVQVCAQVGSSDLTDGYLDAALDALSMLTDATAPQGSDLLHGFSRWARELKAGEQNQDRFLVAWAGLTSCYPFSTADWAERAAPYLNARDFARCPAAGWWAEALGMRPEGARTAGPVQEPAGGWKVATDRLIDKLKGRGLPTVRQDLLAFVARSEAFADATGSTYDHGRNMNRLGQALLDHDPHLSLRLVESSLDRNPFHAFDYGLWARALMRLGRGAAAVKVLWQGIAIDPGDVRPRTILADTLTRLDRHGEAEALYRETMHRFPGDAPSRNALAKLLADGGRIAEAEALYRETMHRFPDNAHARTALAKLLADGGRIAEAEALYRETVANFPQNPVCRLDLGLLLLEHRPGAAVVQDVEWLLGNLRAMKHTAAKTLEVYLDRHRSGKPFQRGQGLHDAEPDDSPLAPGELPEGLLAVADARRAEFLLGGALERPDLLLMTPADRRRLRDEAAKTLARLLEADPSNPALLLIARRYRDKVPALAVANADIVALADSTPVLAIAARRFGLVAQNYDPVRSRWPKLAPLADWAEVLDHAGKPTKAARTLAAWIAKTDPRNEPPTLARLHGELLRLTRCTAGTVDPEALTALVDSNPEGLDELLDLCLLATIEVMPERRLLHLVA